MLMKSTAEFPPDYDSPDVGGFLKKINTNNRKNSE